MATDKVAPEVYADTVLRVLKRLIREGREQGLDIEVEWEVPNAPRFVDGKAVIDTDEAAKNMGRMRVSAQELIRVR